MTVKEVKEALKDIPDDVEISFCTDGCNPYDEWWGINTIIRITDILNQDKDRICFVN